MEEIKTIFVSVELNNDKTCKRVFECRNLTESEYNKLLNEEAKSKEREKKFEEIQQREMTNLLTKLSYHDLFLAKATYDNFVDRGLIEENNEFQQAWYDFVFNGTPLDNKPEEFVQILLKVGEILWKSL